MGAHLKVMHKAAGGGDEDVWVGGKLVELRL